jgi:glycogen(starch) synthase
VTGGAGRLRVALMTIEYPPDPLSAGIGSYTKTLADELAARGHVVHVVARGIERDERTQEGGVVVHRVTPVRPVLPETLGAAAAFGLVARGLPSELWYRWKVARTLTRLAEEEGIDLIEAPDHMAEALFYSPSRFPEIPFVVRLHTPLAYTEKVDPNVPEPVRLAMRALERRVLTKASHLSAPSRVAANAVLREMELDRKVTSYPNPPTLPVPEGGGAEPSEDRLVLFVGRINGMKGPQLLIQAVPGILKAVPDARFLFVGADNIPTEDHPSLGSYLLTQIPEAMRSRVEFVGHIPHGQLASYYRKATVCVFPSLFESFGYTCLEAMGFGKPIVGSANGGMYELLDGGNAGLLFTPPSVTELRSHIVKLLRDPDLRHRLGRNARRRALEVYSRDRVMDQVEEFYRDAVAERRRAAD